MFRVTLDKRWDQTDPAMGPTWTQTETKGYGVEGQLYLVQADGSWSWTPKGGEEMPP